RPRFDSYFDMRIIKPALITLMAICVAASGALAREGKSGTRSKTSNSSSSAKKKRSGTKKSTKTRSAKKIASRERFEGFAEELPLEELPAEDPNE
ncbi:MAG: hypothetical protein ABI883_06735, partial [Chthoniobacterales bacterium]